MMAGNTIRVKDGRIEDPRRIDISQIANMGKMDLEKQCIYLMKKRIALEDVITKQNTTLEGLRNAVKNRDRTLEQRTEQISKHQEITNQTLERLNREKDVLSNEMQRLHAENKELKERVGLR
jgi:cell shape-determining protein MreC